MRRSHIIQLPTALPRSILGVRAEAPNLPANLDRTDTKAVTLALADAYSGFKAHFNGALDEVNTKLAAYHINGPSGGNTQPDDPEYSASRRGDNPCSERHGTAGADPSRAEHRRQRKRRLSGPRRMGSPY
jgi:hypothetical protein